MNDTLPTLSQPVFQVERPGLQTTVQDLGRYGYRRDGMVTGGAMDALASRVANILVGNAQSDAVVEVTLMGPSLRFVRQTVIAIGGGDLAPTLDGSAAPMWTAFAIPRGGTLRFGRRVSGCRAYVAIAGGIDVPLVLGSRSTYLRARIGGFEGRALKAGDIVPAFAPPRAPRRMLGWGAPPDIVDHYSQEAFALPVAVLEGPQLDYLTPQSLRSCLESRFTISTESDRMGYRLDGPPVRLAPGTGELLSEAAAMGAIQITPDGKLVILMADHQTTGGYPVAGIVASVELSRLAQMAPGDSVGFVGVELAEAHAALAQQERLLHLMQWSAQLR